MQLITTNTSIESPRKSNFDEFFFGDCHDFGDKVGVVLLWGFVSIVLLVMLLITLQVIIFKMRLRGWL